MANISRFTLHVEVVAELDGMPYSYSTAYDTQVRYTERGQLVAAFLLQPPVGSGHQHTARIDHGEGKCHQKRRYANYHA